VQAEVLRRTSTQSHALVVEGDLNEAELEDIQQLLDAIGELANDFFAGELDKPLGQAFDLGELDTLSSFSATLEYSHNVSISQRTRTSVARDTIPRLEANATALEAPPLTPTSPQNLLKQILQAVDAVQADPARGAIKAAKLFDQLAEKLARPLDGDPLQQRSFKPLVSQLLRRLAADGATGVL
jgi:hypothetical protein